MTNVMWPRVVIGGYALVRVADEAAFLCNADD